LAVSEKLRIGGFLEEDPGGAEGGQTGWVGQGEERGDSVKNVRNFGDFTGKSPISL
jgi:hypothetical protein